MGAANALEALFMRARALGLSVHLTDPFYDIDVAADLRQLAMSGHFDSLAIVTFLVALFFLVTNRPALSMGGLALSFLSKFFPVLLLLTFLKRVWLAYVGFFVSLISHFTLRS